MSEGGRGGKRKSSGTAEMESGDGARGWRKEASGR